MIVPVPSCGTESREWVIPGHWASRTHAYDACVPAEIGALTVVLPPAVAAQTKAAELELAVLDRRDAVRLPSALPALISAEAIASSLVDGHRAEAIAIARAEAGQPTTASARAITSAAGAIAAHLEAASRALSLGAFGSAHSRPRRLGSGAVTVRGFRTDQVWEGGGDLWPRGADFVPPHATRIADAMMDLVTFAARDDVDPIAQAAIVHAQLATIRPFGPGDARVSRAAIHGVWRRRGVVDVVAAPVAAALLAHQRRHRDALAAYRAGDAGPIVALLAQCTVAASTVATEWLPSLAALPETWRDAARARAGSAASALLARLAAHPIVDATEVRSLTGASQASAYEAIQRLADAGVLTRISPTRRETVWAALDVFRASLDLVAHLAERRPLALAR